MEGTPEQQQLAAVVGAASHGRTQTAAATRPRVPDHPPYVEMVREALCALAEPGGSSERSISDYIVASFSGLPPAHDLFLPYYLRKFVSSSYLDVTSTGRYLPRPELMSLIFRRGNRMSSPPGCSPSTRVVVAPCRHRVRPIKDPLTMLPRNMAVSVPVTRMDPLTLLPRNEAVSVPVTSTQIPEEREESSSSSPFPAAAIQRQPLIEGDELQQSDEESSQSSAAISFIM